MIFKKLSSILPHPDLIFIFVATAKVADRVFMDCVLRSLLKDEEKAVGMRQPGNMWEMVHWTAC